MKQLYFLLFFAFSFITNAQIVNIPDPIFKNYLVSNFDTNMNGEIDSGTETNNIHTIDIANMNINDITGIEEFPGLTHLFCSNNGIGYVNLLNNYQLFYLDLSNNPLTSIDVGFNPQLLHLNCEQTYIYEIDVSNCVNLNFLNVNQCTISNLDLSQNTYLETLYCHSNFSINVLDISNNIALKVLDCSNNSLSSLDISNNQALEQLYCQNNQLTSLDVSNNPTLEKLYCSDNQLTNLNIKNGNVASWVNLNFSINPNLQYICADDEDIFLVQQNIDSYGYGSTCHVNSYCSFTPGGIIYEISGNAKIDTNSNGCDVTDLDYPNLKFVITDGTNSGSFISNNSGNYYIPVQAGNYTVTPALENPTYFNILPANFTVDFPTQASPFTQDFCVTVNGVHSDVEVIVMPTTPARPGFDVVYKIVYRNKGNQIENGSVTLTFDDAVLDYVLSNPVYNSTATNSFTWNYTNLQPFETREIEITFNVNSPMESPAVNNGDILDYTATITTANTDETPADNTFTLNQTVVGSYDPNDKTCLEGETVEPNMIGEYVHYVIRFENTGTFPAENIVVKDMIDLAKFDIATLIPLKGSHDYYTRIKDNKVEFIFENINLDFNDATNDGYVAFKIKTKSTLVVGDTFSNNANIYFDYNFPITTNTYTTTVESILNNQSFEFGSQFTLYPNPAKEVLNIQSINSLAIQSVEIYNVLGQVVLSVPNTTNAIDVSNLKTGTYFIKVNTENGTSNTKFIKE